jgi:hypothetical protein
LVLFSATIAPAAEPRPGTSQVRFTGPAGMRVYYQVSRDGKYSEEPLVVPAKLDFGQGAIYRLKLTHIPGYEDLILYPTLEIAHETPRAGAFLAHSSIVVQLTPEDFGAVAAGRFVTKAVYLPDPEHAAFAIGGVEELVSTRVGGDAISSASRRGTIMAILRMGNRDLTK